MAKVLYTIGYEGRSQHDLLERLRAAGVRCLIDVRRNAVSRKRGFSKKALEAACVQYGLRYIHIPQLGISSEMRKHYLADGRYDQLLAFYTRRILPAAGAEIAQVVEMAKAVPCVLMCFESEPERCHRSWLARRVSEQARMTAENLR